MDETNSLYLSDDDFFISSTPLNNSEYIVRKIRVKDINIDVESEDTIITIDSCKDDIQTRISVPNQLIEKCLRSLITRNDDRSVIP